MLARRVTCRYGPVRRVCVPAPLGVFEPVRLWTSEARASEKRVFLGALHVCSNVDGLVQGICFSCSWMHQFLLRLTELWAMAGPWARIVHSSRTGLQ